MTIRQVTVDTTLVAIKRFLIVPYFLKAPLVALNVSSFPLFSDSALSNLECVPKPFSLILCALIRLNKGGKVRVIPATKGFQR